MDSSYQDLAREFGLDDDELFEVYADGHADEGGQYDVQPISDEMAAPFFDGGNSFLPSQTQASWGGSYPHQDQSSDEAQQTTSSPTPFRYSSRTQMQPSRQSYVPPQPIMSQNKWKPAGSSSAYMQGNAPSSYRAPPPNREHDDRPRNAHGIRLRPVSELPDLYRGIFKFGVFNAVQSTCFDEIMRSNQNMVVSAPTGGGKTVLFELGIIKTLIESGHKPSSKCVYVAPTKALCSERFRDWNAKLEPLNVKCVEMTGDTIHLGKSAWSEAKNATIIITTGEKWDSLTRSWHDHGDFLSEIKLFLVDEVHILNESRGSTLEVVISRMKARAPSVRFIMVSATVPNIRDIADWIGNPSVGHDASALVHEFGDQFRPCKLTRHVYGFPRKNQNDFQFQRTLDYKLYDILLQHCTTKPTLVFCPTRKGVVATAEQLLKDYEEGTAARRKTPWVPAKIVNRKFNDSRLEKLASAGIGVHHAGLHIEDRRCTEALFLDGSLRIVVATSTLAVGVNLPAHTVVIKGVKLWQANAWQEYSDLDVVQMVGRAGRPQFDKEGVAIIMCELELEGKYKNVVQGKTVLESSLHHNLVEHINSEIGIHSITDLSSAKEWIRASFLRQRIQKNPGHYQIGKAVNQSWEEKLDELAIQSISVLKDSQLVSVDEEKGKDDLTPTTYGDIMSKYYIRHSTMDMIIKMPERASIREILEVISGADELGDLKLRGGDKQAYSKLKDNNDIRYKIKKVEKASDKAFLLIQAVLGGISLSSTDFKTTDSQPALEALSVFRHTSRICRAAVEVAIAKRNGAQTKSGLELLRCLTAKAWEDRPVVLKQVDSIGEKSLKVLTEAGITSLQAFKRQEPIRIEMLLNRRPPYGHEIIAFLNDLPQYEIAIVEEEVRSYGGTKPVEVELSVTCGVVSTNNSKTSKSNKPKTRTSGSATILTLTSDLDFVDFRRTSNKSLKETRTFNVTVELRKPSMAVNIFISSENFAGLTVMKTYKPNLPASEYPTLDTRPKDTVAETLDGLEDNADFWNMDIDDDVDVKPVVHLPVKAIPTQKKSIIQDIDALTSDSAPKKLANGKYECNHTCKDKSKCRHYCCREGLDKPQNASKRLSDSKKDVGSSASKSKQPPSKTGDKRLQHLETIHQKTGVKKSLGITEGKRIRLEVNKPASSTSVDRKKDRPRPRADLTLSPFSTTSKEADSDSEDLPEPTSVINENRARLGRIADSKRNSEIDFSDPEMDAIILSVDTEAIAKEVPSKSRMHSKRPIVRSDSPEIVEYKHRGAKRQKTPAGSAFNHDTLDEPLFLPDSNSDPLGLSKMTNDDRGIPRINAGDDDDDFFGLKSHLTDITDTTGGYRSNADLTSSSVTLVNSSMDEGDRSSYCNSQKGAHSTQDKASIHAASNSVQQEENAIPEERDIGNAVDDELEDFESWLRSGAVEIID